MAPDRKAAAVVRRLKKDPSLGARPDHPGPLAGKELRVFDPHTESLEELEKLEPYGAHPIQQQQPVQQNPVKQQTP